MPPLVCMSNHQSSSCVASASATTRHAPKIGVYKEGSNHFLLILLKIFSFAGNSLSTVNCQLQGISVSNADIQSNSLNLLTFFCCWPLDFRKSFSGRFSKEWTWTNVRLFRVLAGKRNFKSYSFPLHFYYPNAKRYDKFFYTTPKPKLIAYFMIGRDNFQVLSCKTNTIRPISQLKIISQL